MIKHSVKKVFPLIIYHILIDVMYLYIISPNYSYLGLVSDFNWIKLAVSYVAVLAVFFLMDHMQRDSTAPSSIIIQWFFLIMIEPLCCIYALANFPTPFLLMCLVSFSITIIVIYRMPYIRIRTIKNSQPILKLLFPAILIFNMVLMFRRFGIHFSALDFGKIYGIRAEQDTSGLIAYITTWSYKIICPVLFVYSIRRKSIFGIVACAILQLLLYFMYPHKTVLFSFAFILLGMFMLKTNNLIKPMSIFLSFAAFMTSLYTILTKKLNLAILVGRLIHIPALIKFEHYIFFSTHEKLYYSEGVIGKIIGTVSPYQQASGFLITEYFSGLQANSNTGYLAYGYDNFGFAGMIIMSVLLAIVLKYFDSVAKRIDWKLIASLIIYPFVMLNDADFLTMLLTGGGILLMFSVLLFNEFQYSTIRELE